MMRSTTAATVARLRTFCSTSAASRTAPPSSSSSSLSFFSSSPDDGDDVLRRTRERLSAAASAEDRESTLRFDMTGLTMSDRVRRLLELTNGSRKEVVKAQKRKGMELFRLREGDTGSSAVQVIAVTTRIQQMQAHLETHKKDFSGKRTLQRLFVRRRKLLDYMERKEFDSYRHVVKTLGLARR